MMRVLGEAELGASVLFASIHPHESCGSNGLPLTPNSITILGRFQILKSLEHPSLCKYISIERGKHERLIVITEHYRNHVRDAFFNGLFKNEDRIIQLAYEVLRGLAYLNTYGIVNHCLAPENILLNKEGHAKLTKYGIYHMTDGGSCVSFPIGVPKYLPIEVLAAGPVVTSDHVSKVEMSFGPKSDVWSLGIILAELLLDTEFWQELPLKSLFMKLFSLALNTDKQLTVLEKLANEHGLKLKDSSSQELLNVINACLQVSPDLRPTPEELLNFPAFAGQNERFQDDKLATILFLSTELRCRHFELSNYKVTLTDDPLSERSLEEVYYLWQLAGGDLDTELKRLGIVKSKPPICSLPKIVIEEGEFFGQKKDQAFLLDETFVTLSLDQLRQRLSKLQPEAFYPLTEESTKAIDVYSSTSEMEAASKLPLVIREKDIEYQLHRIVLFEKLLKGYPYKRPHIVKEAKTDIPPLYRAHVWAALLDVEGDLYTQYDVIDKETPTITDRQIEVDIPRCHQYDELLSSSEGHGKFKRLLKAWVVSHPQYVYWQGLDSLCAPFLYLTFNNEALAYACITAFISKYLHKFFLKDNSPIIQEYLAVFSHLIAFHDPELTNHLNSIGFIPELYAIPWFLTMYTHVFPLHKIFHLWDTLLLGDPSFPLCIGVAILQQMRDNLMSFGFNECILLFSDMPEIDIELCVVDSIKIFCSTPRSATYRQHERPPEKVKKGSQLNERLNHELEMDVIPLEQLKSELSPRISAVDLLDLVELKTSPTKSPKIYKPKLIVIDVRSTDEYVRGALPESINIPFQTAFSPDGTLNSCPEASILNSKKGRLIVVIGKRDNNAVNFADQLIKLGYPRVCTLHKGIDVLRSTGTLIIPAAEI